MILSMQSPLIRDYTHITMDIHEYGFLILVNISVLLQYDIGKSLSLIIYQLSV